MSKKFTLYSNKKANGRSGMSRICLAHTQGKTLGEARENLKEAVQLIIEANREIAHGEMDGEENRNN